jgi:hypothetical protein
LQGGLFLLAQKYPVIGKILDWFGVLSAMTQAPEVSATDYTQSTAVGSGNSGRSFSGKSVRFDEEMNSDRLVADQGNEGKDDTYADTTRDPGTAERRPHAEGDR